MLKFSSFAIVFLLYATPQNAVRKHSLARHSENYKG